MIEHATRIYHCHKLKRIVEISEEYELVNGVRTLLRCSCPYYTGTASDRFRCDGQNDYHIPCGFADWQEKK